MSELVVDTRNNPTSCANLTNQTVDSISPGTTFILIADHDPVGLKYMLEAEKPGITEWEFLETGPELWRARVSKVAATQA